MTMSAAQAQRPRASQLSSAERKPGRFFVHAPLEYPWRQEEPPDFDTTTGAALDQPAAMGKEVITS